MSIYYATKDFVRSFSEAVSEEVKGTGVTVTAFCLGPTATGFEQAASMDKGSTMFRKAAKAEDVARVLLFVAFQREFFVSQIRKLPRLR